MSPLFFGGSMFFLVLIILLTPSFASAALSPAEFAQALGTSVPNQLPRSYNILQTTNLVDYRSLHILSNGVDLLRPVADTVSTRPQLLPAATRVAGSRVLLRKGIGLLGPVGVAVTVGMVGKDLYDLVKGSPSEYPVLSALTKNQINAPVSSYLLNTSDCTLMPIGTYIVGPSDGQIYKTVGDPRYNQHYTAVSNPRPSVTNNSYMMNIYKGTSSYWDQYVVYITPASAPAPVYESVSEDQFISTVAPNDVVDAPYTTEFDKATKALYDAGKTAMQPDADQIKTLTNTVQQDRATDAAQTAVDSAQQNYDSNPTAEALQALNEAKSALEAQKAASARDNVVAPPVPDSGNYDSGIELPEKKSILSLLQSFASGSPIVSMLNSFTMSASGSGFVHLGDAFGKSIDVDFTRYESVLGGCGGVLLILVHGFAVLVVVRGW